MKRRSCRVEPHTPSMMNDFYDVEERRLQAKLEGVRAAISHAGEKGRVLEGEVAALIRNMLPFEYGISTGFVADCENSAVRLSPQLDIIIYDAVRGASLVGFDACNIFPLEAVYGYVETKASLGSGELRNCVRQNVMLRRMRQRAFWHTLAGSPLSSEIHNEYWLPMRSFIFSFNSKLKNIQRSITKALAASPEAYIHGIFVGGKGFFSPSEVISESLGEDQDAQAFFASTSHPLTAFKISLMKALATFPRYGSDRSAAVDRYHFGFVNSMECT
jgi:hypothetical protein